VREQLARSIATLYEAGARGFISGMALGVDQWAARGVIALRERDPTVRLVAAVPFHGQDSLWPEHSRMEYARLLEAADERVVVSKGAFAAWKMQARNEWLVNHADVLLAVWDGSAGGTRNCVQYAQRRGTRIVRIDPRLLA
jgi:uncharacterized phage-like protein YoqJ